MRKKLRIQIECYPIQGVVQFFVQEAVEFYGFRRAKNKAWQYKPHNQHQGCEPGYESEVFADQKIKYQSAGVVFYQAAAGQKKSCRPAVTGILLMSLNTKVGHRKSFQRHMIEKIASTARAGRASGRMICQ